MAAGVLVVHSLDEALERVQDAPELACIGGAEVFRLLMPLAARIHLTRVVADIPGDTVFPPIDHSEWVELDTHQLPADERNAFDMQFVTLERVRVAAR
jgi:dihydrofolate reductase